MLIASINYGLWVDSKIQNRVILIKNCSVCVWGADVAEAVCGKGGQCVWEPCAFCLLKIALYSGVAACVSNPSTWEADGEVGRFHLVQGRDNQSA